MNKRTFGKTGELLAQGYLCDKGYEILTANYSAAGGELDLVAFKRGVLVFVEVKAKASVERGEPKCQLSEGKKAAMYRAAMHYAKTLGGGGRVKAKLFGIDVHRKYRNIRFDLLELLYEGGIAKRVIHTKNVIKTES